MEKEFNDEVILKKREEIKKQKYVTIENGCYVRGKILKFILKDMFHIFSLYMPDNMCKMPEELAKIKYPSEYRPDSIYTTLDLSVNIGFNILGDELQIKDVQKVAERMRAAIQRSNSSFQFYEIEKINKNSGCYFDFRSHAIDVDIYNMIYLVSIENNLIQSNFNCLYQQKNDWKKVVKLIWESIEKIDDRKV